MANTFRTNSTHETRPRLKSETFIPHSIPVPDLFRHAKNILRLHMEGRGAVKKLVFEGKYRNFQKLFAVVQKTVGQFDEIQKVLIELGIFANHPQLDPYLATILASQIVERGNDIPGQCKPILTMNSYKCQLLDKLQKCEVLCKTEVLPTYVRINILKTTPEFIHEELKNYGFIRLVPNWNKLSYKDFLDIVKSLEKNTYITDYHIPDLLVFPPRQAFWYRPIFTDSLIIVQDKASCLPAFLSGVQPGMNVIDACAAPGNKSTHLASLMKNQGSLTAVEKDFKRYETLKKLIKERGASSFISAINSDFTSIDRKFFENTELILVDPSCSSSGTAVHCEDVSIKRVDNLAFFQLRILEHALSFPHVKTVLYSTCSVNEKENEAVVEEALKKFGHRFKLAKLNKCLKEWQHFGSPNYDCGKYCLRTNKWSDKCHGFFVAKFKRKRLQIFEDNAVQCNVENEINTSKNSCCNVDENKTKQMKNKRKKFGLQHSEVDVNFGAENDDNLKKKSKRNKCSNNNEFNAIRCNGKNEIITSIDSSCNVDENMTKHIKNKRKKHGLQHSEVDVNFVAENHDNFKKKSKKNKCSNNKEFNAAQCNVKHEINTSVDSSCNVDENMTKYIKNKLKKHGLRHSEVDVYSGAENDDNLKNKSKKDRCDNNNEFNAVQCNVTYEIDTSNDTSCNVDVNMSKHIKNKRKKCGLQHSEVDVYSGAENDDNLKKKSKKDRCSNNSDFNVVQIDVKNEINALKDLSCNMDIIDENMPKHIKYKQKKCPKFIDLDDAKYGQHSEVVVNSVAEDGVKLRKKSKKRCYGNDQLRGHSKRKNTKAYLNIISL